jgi:hypothetical protein
VADPGGDGEVTLPGRIDCARLSDALKIVEPPWRPFGGEPVYEFDASAQGNARRVAIRTNERRRHSRERRRRLMTQIGVVSG